MAFLKGLSPIYRCNWPPLFLYIFQQCKLLWLSPAKKGCLIISWSLLFLSQSNPKLPWTSPRLQITVKERRKFLRSLSHRHLWQVSYSFHQRHTGVRLSMLLNNVYGKNQLLVSADNNKGKTFLRTSQILKA